MPAGSEIQLLAILIGSDADIAQWREAHRAHHATDQLNCVRPLHRWACDRHCGGRVEHRAEEQPRDHRGSDEQAEAGGRIQHGRDSEQGFQSCPGR